MARRTLILGAIAAAIVVSACRGTQNRAQAPGHPNVLVHYPHGDGEPDRHLAELYDLRKDAGELKNLINDPGSAPELGKLKKELAELMAATGLTPETDRMPIDEGIKQELPDQKIR